MSDHAVLGAIVTDEQSVTGVLGSRPTHIPSELIMITLALLPNGIDGTRLHRSSGCVASFHAELTVERSRFSQIFRKPPEALLRDLVNEGFRYDDCVTAAKLYSSKEAAVIYLEQLAQHREHEKLVLFLRRRGFYRPHCEKALKLWPDVMDALRYLQHQQHERKEGCVFCDDSMKLEGIPQEKLKEGVKLKPD
ncbi:hypothetical protein A1Q1_03622 [Trichosporon asahii var. asahii CBS 2479]|uniref:Uncharacterized protein n=1 Tax=Trichosporon asahii var. asahii (strain ATCC 90039 / CBS 2479 / JCM 2466 / KCTC 7840 / NBRC 103889/ NCYC 2677 / UAMH 7654) TaxID=1186058 RepID=J4U9Z6_TRIAS|nr:hypothetical protein A1Q1_03622 [Trichosporon asahii var. asahii CBS 2479]EJT47510.1 hypothetical protein A1Q1_03622 [Trichosporon asahii var. asahii CBS 2479]